ncbi:carbohydrate ABC transporter permease [Pelagovum pacificum]|uniref:Carbohydrate ABC transporter permease n=1 Tax=Pelagovum pacificum TaxID=2588711 RepID=A0A5C5GGH0_9RHOB|nr:carbohydrate ABC transporter permease [Pelagovum pacificum]QQA43558.1 carbohydrate ABC transporter permease [Pelagovum pacificum]TNY33304.1 carbohydrate ABC transporter permease [Pelagovum pacificum]
MTDVIAANRNPARRLVRQVVLWGLVFLMSYPLLWMISSSLKPESAIFTQPGLIPERITFSNYTEGWTRLNFSFGLFMVNSVVICMLAILGNLFSCSLAAYAFARLRFPFSRLAFGLMLATLMLPVHVTILPQYIVFQKLGAVNTILPLVLPKFFAVDAFFIFLMVQFIRGIPRDLDQAAEMDGCNKYQIFWFIVFPLCRPALVLVAIFTFLWTWNDFFSQLIYLSDASKYTAPLALNLFIDATSGESAWGMLFAMSVVTLLPLFILFVLFQKQIAEGVATTGMKG